MLSLNIVILFFLSLSLRFILEKSGQSWIRTKSHTATLTILPLVTFVITKVISGNISLSLGMVGALSIVRFRNPVRSPLELTVYFASITMGITAAVSSFWLLFLGASIYIFSYLLFLISFITKKYFKKQFFTNSFSEGTSLCTLEIETNFNNHAIESSKLLKSIYYSKDENVKYLLAASEIDVLKEFILNLKDQENIVNYQLNQG